MSEVIETKNVAGAFGGNGHEDRQYNMKTMKKLHREAHCRRVSEKQTAYRSQNNLKTGELIEVVEYQDNKKVLKKNKGYIPLRQFIREFDYQGGEPKGKALDIYKGA